MTIRDAQGRTAEERNADATASITRADGDGRVAAFVETQLQGAPRTLPKEGDDTSDLKAIKREMQPRSRDARTEASSAHWQGRKGPRPPSGTANGGKPQAIRGGHEHARAIGRESQGFRSSTPQNHRMSPPPGQPPKQAKCWAGSTDLLSTPPISSQLTQSLEHKDSHDDAQNYRHVPRVAASQFERTTTVEPAEDRHLIHKLSQPAMNFHMGGPEQDMARRSDNASPFETMHSMERVRSHRDREYDRNQFQHPPILEELAAHDDKQFRLPLRQTFETHFAKSRDTEGPGLSQRFSVGSSGRPRESLEAAGFSIHHERTGDSLDEEASQMKWRVDWTQSDEARPPTDSSNHSKLRKTDSKWTLKGRLPSFQKSKENNTSSQDADKQAAQSPTSPISPTKSSFFGRFKR